MRVFGGLVFAGLPAVALVGVAGLWLFGRTAAGNRAIQELVEAQVDGLLVEGDFELGGLSTNLWNYASVTDLSLKRADGKTVVGARQVDVDFKLIGLMRGEVVLPKGTIDGLVLNLELTDDGMDIAKLFPESDPTVPDTPWDGIGVDVDLRELDITDATITYRMGERVFTVGQTDATAVFTAKGKVLTVDQIAIEGQMVDPTLADANVAGKVVFDGDTVSIEPIDIKLGDASLSVAGTVADLQEDTPTLELTVTADPLDLMTIDPLAGGVGLAGAYSGAITLVGPLRETAVQGSLGGADEDSAGNISIDAVLDLGDKQVPWSGQLIVDGFDIEDAYPGVGGPIVATGTFDGSGRGITWPSDVNVNGTFEPTALQVREYAVEPSTIPISVAGGVVSLSDAKVNTGYGQFSATGTLDAVGGELNIALTGDFDAADLSEIGVEDLGGKGKLDVDLTGNVLAEGLPLNVDGEVVIAPFLYTDDVRFRRVVADVKTRLSDGLTDVYVGVNCFDGLVYGYTVETVAVPDVTVHRDVLGNLDVVGTADANALRQPGLLAVDSAVGPFTFNLSAAEGSEPVVTADMELGPLVVQAISADGGTAVIDMADGIVEFDVELAQGAREFLSTQGTFGQATSEVRMERLRVSPEANARWTAPGPVWFTLSEGGLADAHIDLRSDRGDLKLDGSVGTVGPIGGTLSVHHLDLALVDRLGRMHQELGGTLNLEVGLAGTGQEPEFQAAIKTANLEHSSLVGAIGIDGTVRGKDGELITDLVIASLEQDTIEIAGSIPAKLDFAAFDLAPRERVNLTIDVLPGALDRFDTFLGEDSELPLGVVSARLLVNGFLYNPNLGLAGVLEANLDGWDDNGRTEFEVIRRGGALTWHTALYEGLNPVGEFGGTGTTRMHEVFDFYLTGGPEPDFGDYSTFVDDMWSQLELRDAPAASLADLGGSKTDVMGDVDLIFSASGSPNSPVLSAAGSWHNAAIGSADVGLAILDFKPFGDGYNLTMDISFPNPNLKEDQPDPTLLVRGFMPLAVDLREKDHSKWSSGDWDLLLTGVDVPLALATLADPGVKRAAGDIQIDGTVKGALMKPKPDVTVAVSDGLVDYAPLGVTFEDITMDMHTNERRVKLSTSMNTRPMSKGAFVEDLGNDLFGLVDEVDVMAEGALSGQRAGGNRSRRSIFVGGTARLEDWTPTTIGGQVRLDRALLSATEQLDLVVDGVRDPKTHQAISIGGTWPELQVDGAVRVDRATVVRDTVSFQSAAPLKVSNAIVIHRAGVQVLDQVVSTEPPIYQDFDVNIDVDLGRRVDASVFMPMADDFGQFFAQAFRTDVVAKVGGKLKVGVEQAEIVVLGEVDILEGTVRVLHQTMALDGGRIFFAGSDYFEPQLALTAAQTISGARAEVNIAGTPSKPDVTLSSPDYGDQSQVLMMLLTNKRPEEVSAQGSAWVQQAAIEAAKQALFGGGTGGAGFGSATVNLDIDGTVTVGVPVGRNIFVEYEAKPNSQVENTQAVSVEATAPWEGFQGVVLQGATGDKYSTAELGFEKRFDRFRWPWAKSEDDEKPDDD